MTLLAERITVDREQCGGRPCIRGMGIRVSDILGLLAAGLSADQVLVELPDLELEDIHAALRFASQRLDQPSGDEVLSLVDSLTPEERVRLVRRVLRPSGDASTYRVVPPGRDEFTSDEEPLAWDGEGWEDVQ